MNKKELAVVAFIILILASILLPAVQQARLASSRLTAENALKQLSLGLLNYESAYKILPIGCAGPGQDAKHGWYIRLAPFLEASSLYSRIDQDQAWDDPVNRYLFCDQTWLADAATEDRLYTQQGYGVIHYKANVRLIHRGSAIRIQDLPSGADSTWAFCEGDEDLRPYASPFNWCEFGEAHEWRAGRGGSSIAMSFVDGSVRRFDVDMGQEPIRYLENSMPKPSLARTRKPRNVYRMRSMPMHRCVFLKPEAETVLAAKGQSLVCLFQIENDPSWTTLEFSRDEGQYSYETLARVVDDYPHIRTVVLRESLNDDFVRLLTKLPKLKTLSVSESSLGDEAIRKLVAMKSLKTVRGLSKEDLSRFQEAKESVSEP